MKLKFQTEKVTWTILYIMHLYSIQHPITKITLLISISNKSNNSRRNHPEKTSTDPAMFRVMHSNAVSPFFFLLVTLPRFSHEAFTFLLFFRFCRNACTRVHAAIQLNILVGSPCT